MGNWSALLGLAKLPESIVDKLNKSAVEAIRSPDGQAKFGALGFDTIASTPEAFDKQLRDDVEKWGKVMEGCRH